MSVEAAGRWPLAGAGLLVALLLAGCGAAPVEESAAPQSEYYEVTRESPFYKQGPAQAFGPDFSIAAGQKVTMLKPAYGFSQVRLNNFITGYLATEDLKAILPPPVAARPRPAPTRGGSGIPRRSNVQPVPNDPLFDINDVPSVSLPQR